LKSSPDSSFPPASGGCFICFGSRIQGTPYLLSDSDLSLCKVYFLVTDAAMIFAGSFENRMDLIGSSIRQAGKLPIYCELSV
jgi:hypothetical protein